MEINDNTLRQRHFEKLNNKNSWDKYLSDMIYDTITFKYIAEHKLEI